MTEFDEFFIGRNAEMTRILRTYLGVGMSAEGPLPQVEVIACVKSLRELPDDLLADPATGDVAAAAFLRVLGEPIRPWATFKTSWYHLSRVDRDRHYDIGGYQILASIPDQNDADSHRLTAGSDEDELRLRVSDLLVSLGPMLAVHQFYRRHRDSVLAIRNELVSLINGTPRRLRRLLRAAHRKIARASVATFREARVWAEVAERADFAAISSDVEDLSIASWPPVIPEPIRFRDHIRKLIHDLHVFSTQQLTVLKSAYREVLEYQAVEVNDRLQRRVLALSVVATLAALIALVPETTRNSVIAVVTDWIESGFRFFIGRGLTLV